MEKPLQGRVALVTGASRRLGRATALELGRLGAAVVVNYRANLEAATQTAGELENALVLQADVTSAQEAAELVTRAHEWRGRLDMVVNNVGDYPGRKLLSDHSLEDWDQTIASNLSSVFYVTRAALPLLLEQGWGRVINLGLEGAESARAMRYWASQAAAKAAVVSLTRSYALQHAESGVTFNVLNPTTIDQADGTRAEALALGDVRGHRPASGEDLARVIGFLCQEESDMINGAVIQVGVPTHLGAGA